jgi:hypothetical protein
MAISSWQGKGWFDITDYLARAQENGWQVRYNTYDQIIVRIPARIGQDGGWHVLDRANCVTGAYWLWVPRSTLVLKKVLQETLPDAVIRSILY